MILINKENVVVVNGRAMTSPEDIGKLSFFAYIDGMVPLHKINFDDLDELHKYVDKANEKIKPIFSKWNLFFDHIKVVYSDYELLLGYDDSDHTPIETLTDVVDTCSILSLVGAWVESDNVTIDDFNRSATVMARLLINNRLIIVGEL